MKIRLLVPPEALGLDPEAGDVIDVTEAEGNALIDVQWGELVPDEVDPDSESENGTVEDQEAAGGDASLASS